MVLELSFIPNIDRSYQDVSRRLRSISNAIEQLSPHYGRPMGQSRAANGSNLEAGESRVCRVGCIHCHPSYK